MKAKSLEAIFVILILLGACSSSQKEAEILGRWEGQKQVNVFHKKEMATIMSLEFKSGNRVIFVPLNSEFQYSVAVDTLIINGEKYKIEKLTDTELVITDFDVISEKLEPRFRYYLKRK
jgi:hypothetical protein